MMKKAYKKTIWPALILTVAVLAVWQATGGDYYTKFVVVEQVETAVNPDDPLVAAGFYDEGARIETVSRSSFRLGLLPTPSGLFDKHSISVGSLLFTIWGTTAVITRLTARKYKLAVVRSEVKSN